MDNEYVILFNPDSNLLCDVIKSLSSLFSFS